MRVGRTVVVLAAGAAVTVGTALGLVPTTHALDSSHPAALEVPCSAPEWAEGVTYEVGDQVTYRSRLYEAQIAHTAHAGSGWNPEAASSLWKDLGACDGGSPSPSLTPHRVPDRLTHGLADSVAHHLSYRCHLPGEIEAGGQGATGVLG